MWCFAVLHVPGCGRGRNEIKGIFESWPGIQASAIYRVYGFVWVREHEAASRQSQTAKWANIALHVPRWPLPFVPRGRAREACARRRSRRTRADHHPPGIVRRVLGSGSSAWTEWWCCKMKAGRRGTPHRTTRAAAPLPGASKRAAGRVTGSWGGGSRSAGSRRRTCKVGQL